MADFTEINLASGICYIDFRIVSEDIIPYEILSKNTKKADRQMAEYVEHLRLPITDFCSHFKFVNLK